MTEQPEFRLSQDEQDALLARVYFDNDAEEEAFVSEVERIVAAHAAPPAPAPTGDGVIRTGDADVTGAVQTLYDIAHNSMDWGSGFLDNDEVETVVRFAILMGWEIPSLPDNSPPMASLARKFPEHYEVVVRHIPANAYGPGYDRPYIRVKSPATTHRPETTTDAREANPHG